jgi:hypothetical protein
MNILTIEVVMNGTSHFHFNKYNLLWKMFAVNWDTDCIRLFMNAWII